MIPETDSSAQRTLYEGLPVELEQRKRCEMSLLRVRARTAASGAREKENTGKHGLNRIVV